MALTEQQKEIALRVAREMNYDPALNDLGAISKEEAVEFAARFLAALPKPEPVAFVQADPDGNLLLTEITHTESEQRLDQWDRQMGWKAVPLYATPPQPDTVSLLDIYDQLWGGNREASSDKDVLRRISERGLKLAQEKGTEFIDLFQHLLDEIARLGDIASIGAEKVIQLSEPQPDYVRDAVRDAVDAAIIESLGDAYDCTRVWSAWGYGTMSHEDFSPVAEDAARVAEIRDAVLTAIAAAKGEV